MPLVINLCNEVNAYIYVSYLERPVRFSIADLPKDELKKIRAYMDTVTLPRLTQKERHNDKCFEDFKTYLDKYIENSEEKKYHDYEFKGIEQRTEIEQKKAELQNLQPASFAELSDWIDLSYATDSSLTGKLPKEILIRQLKILLNDHKESDQKVLHALVMQNSFEPFLISMRDHSIDELKKMSRESLEEYRKQALATT